MEVTVLGRYAPFPAVDGACNGYLLRSGGAAVLVDAGPGVASQLEKYCRIAELTAVVCSHLHEDHISDVHCLRFGAMAAMDARTRAERLPIYAPLTPERNRLWIEDGEQWIDLRPLPFQDGLQVGPFHFSFYRTNHPIECYAMRVTDGTSTFFFTADSAFDPELAAFGRGADLAVAECSLIEAAAAKRIFGHMTAAEAGQFGLLAQPRQYLLTHLWPYMDLAVLLAEAHAVNPACQLAEEGHTYRLDT